MLLLQKVSFSVMNNLGTPSTELQINFCVLHTDTENSAIEMVGNTGIIYMGTVCYEASL